MGRRLWTADPAASLAGWPPNLAARLAGLWATALAGACGRPVIGKEEKRGRLREDKKEIETVCDTKLNAAEQKLVVE